MNPLYTDTRYNDKIRYNDNVLLQVCITPDRRGYKMGEP